MSIEFKDFEKQDYQEVVEMIYALYTEDSESAEMNEKKISNTFSALLNNPQRGKIIVFKEQEKIVGYSIIVFCWNTEYGGENVSIEDLYVKPAWRNQGISKRFFYKLMEEYQSKAVALSLEVSPSNTNAQAFYDKLGFLQENNIFMRKMF